MSASLFLEVLADADMCKVMIRVVRVDAQPLIVNTLTRLCKATKQAVYTGFLHSTPRPKEMEHFIAGWKSSRSAFTSIPAYVPVDHVDARRYETLRERFDPGERYRRNVFVDDYYDADLKFPVFEAITTSLERQERLHQNPLADFQPFRSELVLPTLFINQIAFSPTATQDHEPALTTINRRNVLYCLKCFFESCENDTTEPEPPFIRRSEEDEIKIGRMLVKRSSILPIAERLLLLAKEHNLAGASANQLIYETLDLELRKTLPEGENHSLLMQEWTGLRQRLLQDEDRPNNSIARRFLINLRRNVKAVLDEDPEKKARCLFYMKIDFCCRAQMKRCHSMLAKDHDHYPTNMCHLDVKFYRITQLLNGVHAFSEDPFSEGKLSVGMLTRNRVFMVATNAGRSVKTNVRLTGTIKDGIVMSLEEAIALLGPELQPIHDSSARGKRKRAEVR